MDFIVDNYVWFIVGGVIILMAVIGYIADKTDFGRKGKENKVKEEKAYYHNTVSFGRCRGYHSAVSCCNSACGKIWFSSKAYGKR